MTVKGEKLSGDSRIDQPTGWGCSCESFFFRSIGICPTLLGQRETLSRTACRERVRVVCIRFLLHDVHQFELP
jgi:hypothetical protein